MIESVKKDNWTNKYYIKHILFWFFYGFGWFAIGQLFTPTERRVVNASTIIINIAYLVSHILSSYWCIYILIPQYLYKKHYILFILLVLTDVLIFSGVIALVFYIIYKNDYRALTAIFTPSVIIPATFLSVSTTVIGLSAYKLIQGKRRTEIEKIRLEKEKQEAELQFLKAQINPHFLFNAINNIYFLIKKNPEQSAEMLLKFSDLLRYQLYECNTETIFLSKELNYLHQFIDIEKMRKGENVDIRLNETNLPGYLQVPPLLFIPFIENAFKYAAPDIYNMFYIHIHFSYKDGFLVFHIKNSKSKQIIPSKNGGIGIENVKRRLNLIYKSSYNLNIHNDEGYFEVILKIK